MKTIILTIILTMHSLAFANDFKPFNDEAAFRCVVKSESFTDFSELNLSPMTSNDTRSLFLVEDEQSFKDVCLQDFKIINCSWTKQKRSYTLSLSFDSHDREVSPSTGKMVDVIRGFISKTGRLTSRFSNLTPVTCYQDI